MGPRMAPRPAAGDEGAPRSCGRPRAVGARRRPVRPIQHTPFQKGGYAAVVPARGGPLRPGQVSARQLCSFAAQGGR